MNTIQDQLRRAAGQATVPLPNDVMARVERMERNEALFNDAADLIDMLEEDMSDEAKRVILHQIDQRPDADTIVHSLIVIFDILEQADYKITRERR